MHVAALSPLPALRSIARAWLPLLALLLVALGARAAEDFLEPEKAFRFNVRALDPRTLEVQFDIQRGYYLYREQFKFNAEGATLGTPEVPPGKVKFDETFKKNVETHRGDMRIRIPVTQAGAAFTLNVVSQGCADAGLCYPPMTSTAKLALTGFGGDGQVQVLAPDGQGAAAQSSPAPATSGATTLLQGQPAQATPATVPAANTASLTDSSTVDRVLRSGRFWTVIGAFFVMGLLLSLTPCVLPMLPILSSVIVGSGAQQVTRGRSFALAVSYSLGMALVYTALGIAAGLAGEGLAAALQHPLVLAGFAMLLFAFALSMFDVYELQLPSALATHLHGASQKLPAGQHVGVFLMGGVSALIVSPCVTAPLAGALLFLSQSRDVVLGGSALFAMAAGMSVPLLLLGASAGAWLPKSGAWMHAVKRFFGLLLMGVAIWIVQPVLHPAAALAAWGLLLLVAGFMLRPFDPHPHAHAPRVWVQRAFGLLALTLGVLQVVGAASGGRDPLAPLQGLALGAASANAATGASAHGPVFQPVRSVAELDQVLKTAGRPVMLDFYADWCVSCKEMEKFTFADPAIARRMAGAVLLKADVTANSDADRELLKRFRLFGPPGTIFFDAQGRELDGVRVIGFQSAERFGQSLAAAGL
ncbi:thiol:disulfide interchange protein [Burkholderiales bacterium JOSHI_001]|nr:thiol:disulfide interchange protein [Burkholderiales bacterium JOSHI_001]